MTPPDAPEPVEAPRMSMEEFLAAMESSVENAAKWLAWIERFGLSKRLFERPPPDRITLSRLIARTRKLEESRPDLASRVARTVLHFALALPLRHGRIDETEAAAYVVLARLARRRGDLERAERIQRLIHAVLADDVLSPGFDAEWLEERADLLAARHRYREALELARKALWIWSAPYFCRSAREPVAKKIAEWSRAVNDE